jgi:hypothetical protein
MQVTTDLKGQAQSFASSWAARSRELSGKTEAAIHNLELTFWRNVKTLCRESRTVPVKLDQLITKVETRAESALNSEVTQAAAGKTAAMPGTNASPPAAPPS